MAAYVNPLSICEPLGDRIVVRLDAKKDKTEGGIVIPEIALNERQQIGTIIAVGPGRYTDEGKLIPMRVKVDDRVILTGFAGLEIRSDHAASQDEYLILREEDVLARLPPPETPKVKKPR